MTTLNVSAVLIFLTLGHSLRAAPVVDDKKDVTDVQQMMTSLKREMEALREHEKAKEHQVEELQKQIVGLRGSLDEAVGALADEKQVQVDSIFLAAISEFVVETSQGKAIVWDSAPINPGRHFDTIRGEYVVPTTGYYTLSANMYGNNNFGAFYFAVDGQKVAYEYIYTGDAKSCCPNGDATINLELRAGQKVQIINLDSNKIHGTSPRGTLLSWFTGHLLYRLENPQGDGV